MRVRGLLATLLVALLLTVGWFLSHRGNPAPDPEAEPAPAPSAAPRTEAATPLPGEALMGAYGDPATDPIEDLRALDRVLVGYFALVKQEEGFSIGGNEDLAAALRGENAYRQKFLPAEHPAFGPEGRLLDRWGTPVFVHPLAARELDLRSAGPDRTLFTDDDVVLDKR